MIGVTPEVTIRILTIFTKPDGDMNRPAKIFAEFAHLVEAKLLQTQRLNARKRICRLDTLLVVALMALLVARHVVDGP